ncbi:helix-turn-helix transcriptional regulator [Massilia antarctica]|uniref:helix-turn-helix transcriptional regulator n=1 Tax=Massilia antarctica TaxID=2765360 RepID=UPI0027D96FC6|nr:AlpA family phage regulatory protein [Massilia sp. H27-R4]
MPSVLQRTGISKSEIYRRIKIGAFPPPIKLGARAVAWRESAIEVWIVSPTTWAAS